MLTNSWHTSFATVIGTSHQKQDTICQDAGCCERILLNDNTEILLAMVSDGAGSASKSDIASKAIVELFLSEFKKTILEGNSLKNIDKAFVINWLESVRDHITILATEASVPIREYACTVLCAIVGVKEAIFFQLGDGAIVVSKNDSEEYSPVFWPQHGEYANQTNFVIQSNFDENLEFSYLTEQFDKIAVFTDGLERLVLDFTSRTAHAPAFSTIFDWLAKKEITDNNTQCPALAAYLSSEYINSRTDDDKTLIMAIRQPSTQCLI